MSPVKYELGFYIPEAGILHSHRGGSLNPYKKRNVCELKQRNCNWVH
jgi:hypothetical protein